VQVFELPTVLAYPLFYKLVAPESSVVRKDAILHWMSSKQVRLQTVISAACGGNVRLRSGLHLTLSCQPPLLFSVPTSTHACLE